MRLAADKEMVSRDWAPARRSAGVADPLAGLIDEIRVSTLVRSDAWITATYRNLSAPGTFLSADSEETEGGGGPAPRRPIIMTICS